MEMKPQRTIGRIWPVALALLLAQPAASAHATFPGTPGQIVYSKYDNRPGPEYEHEPTGGLFAHGPRRTEEPRQLTSDTNDSEPAVSPDGRRIAFAGSREGDAGFGRQIYLMLADGSGARRVTSRSGFSNGEPQFSPDGRKLVFVRAQPERGIYHLFLLTIATGTLRQLTFGKHEDSEPVFTPSGMRILFVSDRASAGGHDASDIWAIGSDGRRARVLVNGSGAEVSPDVSPNGRRMVFIVEKHIFRVGSLRLARANGTHVRSLSEQRGGECRPCYADPVFAPDGRHLAAVERRESGTTLQVMRPDGTHVRQFDAGTVETEGSGGHVEEPAWGAAG